MEGVTLKYHNKYSKIKVRLYDDKIEDPKKDLRNKKKPSQSRHHQLACQFISQQNVEEKKQREETKKQMYSGNIN